MADADDFDLADPDNHGLTPGQWRYFAEMRKRGFIHRDADTGETLPALFCPFCSAAAHAWDTKCPQCSRPIKPQSVKP